MLPIFVVIGLFVAPSAEAQQVVEIAPDIFVRAGGRSSATGANQAFIVFDSFVVVFDAGGVVEARTLLSEIEARTAKPVRYVVSSHFHPDHSAGAAVFAGVGAQVVAHKGGRRTSRGGPARTSPPRSRRTLKTIEVWRTPPRQGTCSGRGCLTMGNSGSNSDTTAVVTRPAT